MSQCKQCLKSCDSGVNCIDEFTVTLEVRHQIFTQAQQSYYPIDAGTFCSGTCLVVYLSEHKNLHSRIPL